MQLEWDTEERNGRLFVCGTVNRGSDHEIRHGYSTPLEGDKAARLAEAKSFLTGWFARKLATA